MYLKTILRARVSGRNSEYTSLREDPAVIFPDLAMAQPSLGTTMSWRCICLPDVVLSSPAPLVTG